MSKDVFIIGLQVLSFIFIASKLQFLGRKNLINLSLSPPGRSSVGTIIHIHGYLEKWRVN